MVSSCDGKNNKMKLDAAEKLALELMEKYNLIDEGWQFKWVRSIRCLAYCESNKKIICLSKIYVENNRKDKVRKIILHEIAHALEPGDTHGPKWRAKCVELGIKPTVLIPLGDICMPPGKWQAKCKKCNKMYHLYRKPIYIRNRWCTICGPKVKLIFKKKD